MCKVCGFAFRQKGDCNKHERRHKDKGEGGLDRKRNINKRSHEMRQNPIETAYEIPSGLTRLNDVPSGIARLNEVTSNIARLTPGVGLTQPYPIIPNHHHNSNSSSNTNQGVDLTQTHPNHQLNSSSNIMPSHPWGYTPLDLAPPYAMPLKRNDYNY